MDERIVYAIVSMMLAVFTPVISELGLIGTSGDLGLTIRTCFVFVLVLKFAAVVVPSSELNALIGRDLVELGVSGVTTACSWVFTTAPSSSAGLHRRTPLTRVRDHLCEQARAQPPRARSGRAAC